MAEKGRRVSGRVICAHYRREGLGRLCWAIVWMKGLTQELGFCWSPYVRAVCKGPQWEEEVGRGPA